MINLNQQMVQAHLTFLEQNLAASNFTIQQLRMTLGAASQGPHDGPFNPNMGAGLGGMGSMGGGFSQPNFGQQQRRYTQQTTLTSWVVDIQVNPDAPQQVRVTHATGQGPNTVAVVFRDDYMQVSSNSGIVGQQISGYLATNAQYQPQLFAWIFTDNQTLLSVPGIGSALFDTDFVKSLSNVQLKDIRIMEKPKTEPEVTASWVEDIRPSTDNHYFMVELTKLGNFPSGNSYTTGFSQKAFTGRYTRDGLMEMACTASDLVSVQIHTLLLSGELTSSLVKAWRLDDSQILVSVKTIGLVLLTTEVLEYLNKSIEVVDLRPTATAATIQVPTGTIDPLQRGPIGGHETGVSIEDIRGMAEESANAQAPTEQSPNTPSDLETTTSYEYNPVDRTHELGELNIDVVEFVGSAKTSFHQQYKFTFQRPEAGKLSVGVKPEDLEKFIVNECSPITNRGLAVIIGKQNKMLSIDPKKIVFTLVTFKDSDNAIVQLVSDTTRTHVMSKFELARIADKITDDTYLRQIHVG